MQKKNKLTAADLKEQPKVEKYEEIFAIVPKNGVFLIGVGGQIMTPKTFATPEEAKSYIDQKPWELIVNTTCMIYDLSKSVKNNK